MTILQARINIISRTLSSQQLAFKNLPVDGINALNNWLGWNSAKTGFTSVPAGIVFVSEKLANGRYYKDKTLNQKLKAYNPNALYAPKIKALMKEIE
jgi:hypothetical protein